jgi:hypothetical protein
VAAPPPLVEAYPRELAGVARAVVPGEDRSGPGGA